MSASEQAGQRQFNLLWLIEHDVPQALQQAINIWFCG
jgi:hypothetical protein